MRAMLLFAKVDLPQACNLEMPSSCSRLFGWNTDQFMETYSDLFEWVRPKAGAIAFIKFKGPMSSEEFGAHLAKSGIGIKPAYCFTDVVTDDIDYFRVVSVATASSRIVSVCALYPMST